MSKVYLRKNTRDCIVDYEGNRIEATYRNYNNYTYFTSQSNQLSTCMANLVCDFGAFIGYKWL